MCSVRNLRFSTRFVCFPACITSQAPPASSGVPAELRLDRRLRKKLVSGDCGTRVFVGMTLQAIPPRPRPPRPQRRPSFPAPSPPSPSTLHRSQSGPRQLPRPRTPRQYGAGIRESHPRPSPDTRCRRGTFKSGLAVGVLSGRRLCRCRCRYGPDRTRCHTRRQCPAL